MSQINRMEFITLHIIEKAVEESRAKGKESDLSLALLRAKIFCNNEIEENGPDKELAVKLLRILDKR